jgi:hypothetical protein
VAGDNGGAIRLSWTPSVSLDVTEQRVYRATVSGGPYSLITTFTNNTTSTYTNTGLTNGTTYYYVVRAYDGTRESANSSEANAVPIDNSIVPPTGLTAADVAGDNGGAIRLSWTPSVSLDVTEQRVYRATVSGGPYNMVTAIANNTTGSYTDTGLVNGTMCYYVVRAWDGTNESLNSNEASGIAIDNMEPIISNVIVSNISDTLATIAWMTNEMADSQIEYGTTIAYGNTSPLDSIYVTDHGVNLSGLMPSTLYHYRIKSRDTAGNLAISEDFTFMTISNVKSLQSGTFSIAAGSQSSTVTISPVDMTKSFLVFSIRFNDANPGFSQISGQITDSTTLTFKRFTGTGAPAVIVKWYVTEFISGVSVQRGAAAMPTTTVNVMLSQVDTAKSFAIISYRNSGSSYDSNDFVKAKITSQTNLELTTKTLSSSGIVEWQVIEFANAQVQTGDVSFSTVDGVRTAAMNSVDTGKSWLIYSYKTDTGTVANIGQKLVRGVITDSNTLTFDRANTGQAMDLTWYLVEFKDGTTVQHGSQSFVATETQKNVPVSIVEPARSLAVGGYFMRGGRSSYASNDNPGVGWMTLDLTSSTNLQIKLGVKSTADIGWFVVNFP